MAISSTFWKGNRPLLAICLRKASFRKQGCILQMHTPQINHHYIWGPFLGRADFSWWGLWVSCVVTREQHSYFWILICTSCGRSPMHFYSQGNPTVLSAGGDDLLTTLYTASQSNLQNGETTGQLIKHLKPETQNKT